MRLTRLLIATALLSEAGWRGMGHSWQPGSVRRCWKCPQNVDAPTPHSGHCRDHEYGWFLVADCRCEQCSHEAVSTKRPAWRCQAGHQFNSPLCPVCWSLATSEAGEYVCRGPGRHTFYIARDPIHVDREAICPDCRFGYLVFRYEEDEPVCEACGKSQPRTLQR